jgi:hypothetical protein
MPHHLFAAQDMGLLVLVRGMQWLMYLKVDISKTPKLLFRRQSKPFQA